MKELKEKNYTKIDPQQMLAIKKILKEKYPDEDIEKLIEEGDITKLEELLFSQ